MDFNDATALMRLVQAVENDPYVSSEAGEALADKVREFIEDEAELGGWYTELMNAIGEGEEPFPYSDDMTFTECGYTYAGFGFHAQDGTRTDYVIGWPVEGTDGWAVLSGSYDLEDDDLDCHVPENDLKDLLANYGYSSLDDLKAIEKGTWRNELTQIIAEAQRDSRFEVPTFVRNDEAMVCRLVDMGVPEDGARTALVDARAATASNAAHQSPEKAVSLKGEVETARGASAAMADNGNHSNRGQDAR